MTDLIRRKQVGEAWETAVDTGGGGSQTLAQVLVAGGDPDGNPITGELTIQPTASPDDAALYVWQFADTDTAIEVDNVAGQIVFGVTTAAGSGNPIAFVRAREAASDLFELIADGGTPVLNVGPTGAVTISPSAAVSGLTVKNSSAAKTIESNDTGLGFFGATPAAKPTGVAVSAAGIHAALVTLGLIAA